MTTLPVYGGPLKRVLIKRAYAECGQADYNYQIQPEEYDEALGLLNDLMSELYVRGVDLKFNYPNSNLGSPDDESGIPQSATRVIGLLLAESLAPGIGKTLSPETTRKIARSRSLLISQYASIPSVVPQATTPRGSGNRWPGSAYGRAYYPATQTVDDGGFSDP